MIVPRSETEAAAVVSCRWCGAAVSFPHLPPDMYVVKHCSNCGVGLTVPYPTSAQLDQAYGTWYRPDSGRFVGLGDLTIATFRARIAHWVHHISPDGPVLDVGAGSGAMLDSFRRLGRPALGLERRSDRPDVRECQISDCGCGWAAIIMWHSLEHLPNPRQSLTDAALRLRSEGVLVIAIPNAASFQRRLFGSSWFHLDLPRHLTHLSEHQLVGALKEESLTVLKVSHVRGGQVLFGWLQGLVACLPGHPNLYQALRRVPAREAAERTLPALAAAALVAPLAMLCAVLEIVFRRGGTICVVARQSASPCDEPHRHPPST